MKRLITAAAAAVLLISPAVVSAQEHMLEVKRYSDYAKDYLTITDAGLYFYTYEGKDYFSSYVIDEESILAINGSWFPWPGQVVTEINGQSTKGMSETEFYALMDSSRDSVALCILDKVAGSADLTLYPIKEWPYVLSLCGVTLLQINSLKKNASPSDRTRLTRRKEQEKKNNTYCTEIVDSDYDWFYAKTYDFAISGNDPLMDKTLLEFFAGRCLDMSRDTENPDVLLTVAKSADESIQTTYVPPSSRTVNLFLEISMLDAKKINDSLQTAPPIIYQLTYNRHVVNPKFNLDDELKAYATWGIKSDVLWNKYTTAKLTAYDITMVGLSDQKVTSMAENSKAWSAGLRPGDRILRYKYSKKGKWIEDSVPEISNTKYTVLYRCIVKRDGKTVRLDNVRLNERFGDIEFIFWK